MIIEDLRPKTEAISVPTPGGMVTRNHPAIGRVFLVDGHVIAIGSFSRLGRFELVVLGGLNVLRAGGEPGGHLLGEPRSVEPLDVKLTILDPSRTQDSDEGDDE